MNYINLDNLTRYHSKFKDYANAKYTLARDYGWKQTEKAGAVTCWPVGESRLKPVVEFLFKETLPVSDKSSQNPSTITGVASVKVTRTGKNLAELNRVYAFPGRGITAAVNADGSVHVEGTSGDTIPLIDIGNHDDSANKQLPYWMESGKTYTLSFSSSNASGNPHAMIYLPNSLTAWGSPYTVNSGESYIFTVDSTRKRALIRIAFDRNSTINCDCYIQIEEGSSATSFDGTIPDVYTLSLGSTYYGGILDVSTGKLTVTHRMVEADSLTLDISNYPAYLPLECTDTFGRTITSTGNILALTGSTGGKIVYKLANPYTVQIDPVAITALPQIDKYTPRLNTLYTDAENITVKYIKSPIRDEYEKVQAIIANGGTV